MSFSKGQIRSAGIEGTGAQLSDHQQRSRASDEPLEGHLPKLGYSLCREAGLCLTLRPVYHGEHGVRYRAEWLGKIGEAGVRRRAEFSYQQFDALRSLRQEVRHDLLAEAKKHDAWKLIRSIPFIGPIRAALIIAILQTPHRFRAKRQLWTYSGFGITTHSSADHRRVGGTLQRAKKQVSIRGLNRNHNHDLVRERVSAG